MFRPKIIVGGSEKEVPLALVYMNLDAFPKILPIDFSDLRGIFNLQK